MIRGTGCFVSPTSTVHRPPTSPKFDTTTVAPKVPNTCKSPHFRTTPTTQTGYRRLAQGIKNPAKLGERLRSTRVGWWIISWITPWYSIRCPKCKSCTLVGKCCTLVGKCCTLVPPEVALWSGQNFLKTPHPLLPPRIFTQVPIPLL